MNSLEGGARGDGLTSLRPPDSGASLVRIGLVALPLIHLLSAMLHVYFGGMNADEGFYAIAARSVMEGDMLYRDFGYTQPPVVPHVNGLFLAVTGYGLFAQRAVNGLWTALALVIAYVCVARRVGVLPAFGVCATFSLSPVWMHNTHLGKTDGLTTLVALAATWVFLTLPGGTRKQVLLGVLGAVGVGCRLPTGPFFAILWLAALWHDGRPTWRSAGLGALAGLAGVLAIFGPFVVLAWENTQFWLIEIHTARVSRTTWFPGWDEITGMAPAWWFAFVVAAVAMISARRLPRSRDAVLALAALVTIAANVLPRGAYAVYSIPFLLPFAVGVAGELGACFTAANPARRRGLVAAIAFVHVAAGPVVMLIHEGEVTVQNFAAWMPRGVAPYEVDLPRRFARGVDLVERLLPKDQPLLGPNIILAAETGRAVPRNARMGPFTVTSDFDAAKAARLNLLTHAELGRWVADPGVPLFAFFTTAHVNYAWSVPSFRVQTPAEGAQWLGVLRRDFEVVQQEQHFLLLARRHK